MTIDEEAPFEELRQIAIAVGEPSAQKEPFAGGAGTYEGSSSRIEILGPRTSI